MQPRDPCVYEILIEEFCEDSTKKLLRCTESILEVNNCF